MGKEQEKDDEYKYERQEKKFCQAFRDTLNDPKAKMPFGIVHFLPWDSQGAVSCL